MHGKRNKNCGCNQPNCSVCCPRAKKPGPNIPACACRQAFDDAFIENIFAANSFTAGVNDPATQAALLQSFFSPTGCQQFDFDPPTCGTAAILAENTGIFNFIASDNGSLTLQVLSIAPRKVVDCNVIVTVTLLTTFADASGVFQIFGNAELVINPQCQIELLRFFDLISGFTPAAVAAAARPLAVRSVPTALLKRFPQLAK